MWGAYISGTAHLVLILWVILGGILFNARPPEVVASTDVSLLTSEEFAALQPMRPEPQVVQDVIIPAAPDTDKAPSAPGASQAPDNPAPRPEIADPVDPDETPEKPDLTAPQAEVEDTAPDAPTAPVADTEFAALLPPTVDAGQPQDLPRVAPTPALEAPIEAPEAPELVMPVDPTPDPAPDAEPVDPEEPSAPEAATTEIVTEAEKTETLAPATAVRPRIPPARQTAAAPSEPSEPTDETSTATQTDPSTATPAAPAGPPLSFGEKEDLRVAVGNCWNWNALSSDAQRVTVVVYVAMKSDGTPDRGTIRMMSASGGDDRAVKSAYEAARRAIVRCGARGFPLPADKIAHWKEIEMTFNPNKMAIK